MSLPHIVADIASNNHVTLKSWLEVTQGRWKLDHSKLGYGFLFAFHSNCGRIFISFDTIHKCDGQIHDGLGCS